LGTRRQLVRRGRRERGRRARLGRTVGRDRGDRDARARTLLVERGVAARSLVLHDLATAADVDPLLTDQVAVLGALVDLAVAVVVLVVARLGGVGRLLAGRGHVADRRTVARLLARGVADVRAGALAHADTTVIAGL